MIKKLNIIILFSLFLTVQLVPYGEAKNYITSVFLILNNGSPITTEQSIRLSLWSDGRYRSGDVISGSINTSATYYANYQTVVTTIPDNNGRLRLSFGDLSNFPIITPASQFIMIEYKDSADPDTAYTIYTDTYIDGTHLDRFPIIINGPDIFQELYENDATVAENFLLDYDDSGTDLTLTFGKTLAESLSWINSQNYFLLSDALVVDGNVNIQGTTLRLDSDETGNPDQDLDIIASQGTEADGTLRYDDGNNSWQLSNNGGSFFDILTTGYTIPITQARRTSTLTLGGSYTDVTFDTTDIETDSTKLDHDSTTTDRILIKEDGTYLVAYFTTVELTSGLLQGSSVDIRIRVNDTTVISGSSSSSSIPLNIGTFTWPMNRTVMAELNNGDFLSVQMQQGGNAASISTNALFTVQRIGGL